jgi:glycosyltransferase involved in cell wall biosynthesis
MIKPIRVVFDAHAISPHRSGIGEYSLHLCNALVEHCSDDVALHLYVNGAIRPVASPEEIVQATAGVADRSLYALGHQFEIPRLLARRRYDVFHTPDFYTSLFPHRTPLVATIHDVIPLKFAKQLNRSKKSRFLPFFRYFLWHVTHRAAMVLTVSEFSRGEISHALHVNPSSIAVTYPSTTLKRSGTALPESVVRQLAGRPFLLSVGRRDPNKGLPLLLEAYARARSHASVSRTALVIAGPHDDRYPLGPTIERLGLREHAVETGYVEAADLSALYACALAFVMPSLYEGFGVPPLDAMSHGAPVLCSTRTSLPEVVGDAALAFDPEDIGGFSASLALVCSDEGLRTQLKEKGSLRVTEFSWERTARETARVYRVVSDRRR